MTVDPKIISLDGDTATADLNAFTRRSNIPYLHGQLTAINAINDTYFVIDSPNCAFHKTEHVFGSHDWFSTLLDISGRHRVTHTQVSVDSVIAGHGHLYSAKLHELLRSRLPAAIFTGSMPMAAITGIDWEGLAEECEMDYEIPVVVAPSRSLDSDWLHGYVDFLNMLAKLIEPVDEMTEPRPGTVAIVGNFMGRNEEDYRGNLREMRRLIGELGLELICVWLDGSSYADLSKVYEADIIVSFPYGKRAARMIARRSGATAVHCDVPFGPLATNRMLREIGEAAGLEERAEEVIEENMAALARGWEWMIPKRLQHRRIRFSGDPYLMPGMCELTTLLGIEMVELVAWAQERKGFEPGSDWDAVIPVEIKWEPNIGTPYTPRPAPEAELHLCNSAEPNYRSPGDPGYAPRLEFGFPTRQYHCTTDAPFLGYRGAAHFVDRVQNTLGDRGFFF